MGHGRYLGLVLAGTVSGALAGAAWGWWGSGGYESGDSAIGTGLLGALAGFLLAGVWPMVAALVRRVAGRR